MIKVKPSELKVEIKLHSSSPNRLRSVNEETRLLVTVDDPGTTDADSIDNFSLKWNCKDII